LLRDIICLRNICINTLHKGDSDDDDDNNDNNNNINRLGHAVRYRRAITSLQTGSHLSSTDRAAADSYATFDTATLP
jgi:hypothetical protein